MFLTVAGCPMRDTITTRVDRRGRRVAGVTGVDVDLDVMSDEQRKELRACCAAATPSAEIPSPSPAR